MEEKQTLEILAFTDPVCTWCWGSEPVLRKLQVWYGDQIRITPVMGGLVEDIRAFYDRANAIGGDPELSNKQIATHWLEASERHGMPVQIEGFKLFSKDIVSTYPQNIAYKAVELCNPDLAPRFLRRIREASAAEARETGRREVLIELADEVEVDLSEFLRHLEDGSAEQAFRNDLAKTRGYGVRGFPTFLFRWGSKELLLRGYKSFSNMQAAINSLAGNQIQAFQPQKDANAILAFLKAFGPAAPIELSTVFDLASAELAECLNQLEQDGGIRKVAAGNGDFVDLSAQGASCDATTGMCSI